MSEPGDKATGKGPRLAVVALAGVVLSVALVGGAVYSLREPGPAGPGGLSPDEELVALYSERGLELLREPGQVVAWRITSGMDEARVAHARDEVKALREQGAPADEIARYESMAMQPVPQGTGERIHGYPVLKGPLEVGAPARELAGILNDPEIYLWGIAKSCAFMPGFAVRYSQGSDHLDLLFCFSCDEVRVIPPGRGGKVEDFDPAASRLKRVLTGLFPG